ncbi:calcineurin-like phosphoesterase family protein [Lactobacillus selangorensis]|uniref:Calcineurin-like phosphoesterase family protein n=2 Tax=Lactobacillus selangorensis TaxID=81857 RepID=A0A0R2FGR6_9LACO|nr:calcineurin-like phosphoesterase family protein [Lactobacillus selangorensis]KRN31365.1 calcineurin-like phosphoesterase family protein [Lactobacillus selangorensis]
MGQEMIHEYLPRLKQRYKPQVTIVNGENATLVGKGITKKIYKGLLQDGADVVTMGNHTWDNQEILDFIDQTHKLVRPANFPEGTPGRGFTVVNVNQQKLAVINLQGRVFLNDLDDPFRKADALLTELLKQTDYIFIDFHAETTSEKMAFARYVDGRASAVVGTHTHVQTSDARILPQGTAYLTDAGMTGPYDGVLGTKYEKVIQRFLTQRPVRFEVETDGGGQLDGCVVDLSDKSGRARQIKSFQINPDHPFMND